VVLITPRALPIRQASAERQRRVIVINQAARGTVGPPGVTARTFAGRSQRAERLDRVVVPGRGRDGGAP
jgi:hypothetical protein